MHVRTSGSVTSPRERAASLALYAGLAVAVFLPHLAGDRVFSFRDLFDYAIPLKLFSVAELLDGRLPLWNPHSFFGFPHLANLQSGVLYPPNLLLLIGFPLGFNLVLVLHYVVAALGGQALARALGSGLGASRIAGLIYGFAPFLASLNDVNAYLFTSCWLPWLVVFGLRLGERPSARRVAATSALFAVAFLAAEPQTLAVGSVLAATASAFGPWRRLPRLAVAWAGAGAITLLLVAPVLLPFLELVSVSERAGVGMTDAQIYQHSLSPPELVNLVLPGFGGDVVEGTHWLGDQTYVRRVYLGAIALILAALGVTRGVRFRVGLVLLAVGGVLLALGPDGVVLPALLDLGFRQSRFPVKFLVVTVLAVAVLAASGFDRLRRADDTKGVWLTLTLAAGCAAVAASAHALVDGGPVRDASRHVLAVVAAAALAVVWRRLRPTSIWPLRLLAAVAAVDLVVAGAPVLTTAKASELTTPAPEVEIVRGDRAAEPCAAGRVFNPAITEESLTWVHPDGRYDAVGMARKKSLLYGNLHLLWGLSVIRGGESVEVSWASEVLEQIDRGPAARRLVDLVGARYALARHDLEPFGFEPLAAASVGVWRNPTALPRAFIAGAVQHVPAPERRLEKLASPAFDPEAVTLVEEALEVDPACAGATAAIRTCSSDALTIDVVSPGRCLLVVTDTWYPGWEARVDGDVAAILRVDHAFRGVVIPPGQGRVELRYRPASFRRGLALAALGLAVALGCVVSGRRGRASRPS